MAKRDYQNNYPSVTTVLGVLRKIALEFWFKKNTLEFINRESGIGKKIGTDIHTAIESFVLNGTSKFETEYPVEVTNALMSFMQFHRDYAHIPLKWSEMALTSEKYQYNGTIDCISDGIILDWKTGKAEDKEAPAIYDEYKYQVAAYVNLYNEIHNTNIDKAIIVSVAKDKVAYGIYEMGAEEIFDCFNEVFLPALKITNYQKRKDKSYGLLNGHEGGATTREVAS